MKRFGTADLDAIRQLAEDYAKLCEARDAAQASVNAKSAAADTLYSSLSSNEQGILLEVRRFAPDAFDIPTADQLLRACAVRRKELAEAETAAREARMRYELQVQQAPAPGTPEADVPAPVRSREAISTELDRVRAALAEARSSADRLDGQLHAAGDPAVLRASAEDLAARKERLERSTALSGWLWRHWRGPTPPCRTASLPLWAAGQRRSFPTDRQPLCRCGAGPELPPSRQSLWETRCSGMPPCSPPARWTSCIWRCAWPSVSWCCRRRSRCPSCWTTPWPILTTAAALRPCSF
ncbi:MAG: hypothetical protein ACLTYN_15775 [Dysosmobacter welbionis]